MIGEKMGDGDDAIRCCPKGRRSKELRGLWLGAREKVVTGDSNETKTHEFKKEKGERGVTGFG